MGSKIGGSRFSFSWDEKNKDEDAFTIYLCLKTSYQFKHKKIP